MNDYLFGETNRHAVFIKIGIPPTAYAAARRMLRQFGAFAFGAKTSLWLPGPSYTLDILFANMEVLLLILIAYSKSKAKEAPSVLCWITRFAEHYSSLICLFLSTFQYAFNFFSGH